MRFGFIRYVIKDGSIADHAEQPRLLIDRTGRLNRQLVKCIEIGQTS